MLKGITQKFDKFLEKNLKLLSFWKKGCSYPIVDAGMRELYKTG